MFDLSDKGWLANTILGPPPDPEVDTFNHVIDLLLELSYTMKDWGRRPATSDDAMEAWGDGKALIMRWTEHMEHRTPKTLSAKDVLDLADEVAYIVQKHGHSIPKDVQELLHKYARAFRDAVSGPKPEGS